MLTDVLSYFSLRETDCKVEPYGNGLINRTWLVSCKNKNYILQRVNDRIFRQPWDIAHNIRAVGDYLKSLYPDYLFVLPVQTTVSGKDMVENENGFFRLFPFVTGSKTIDFTSNAFQAYEAAAGFGNFTALLSGFDVNRLKITLPDFHNLTLRHNQFITALESGNPERIMETRESISFLITHSSIAEVYEKIKINPAFKLRVTHHDTKISNILFDKNDRTMCVIDLDTLMPGYFISDVGDMMRTYLSPVTEEEKDYSRITIRTDCFEAIVRGYAGRMKDVMTSIEKKHFVYAGKFMIYMQALRFLTDYLNNDTYYQAKYPGHNLTRANNQIELLKRLLEKEGELTNIASKEMA